MNSKRRGFTLIELLVVVLIIGVLASVGTPAYMKTVESTRATDSVGMAQMIANAQRMCILDHPTTSGSDCAPGLLSSSHKLVAGKYLATSDWNSSYYNYYSCNGSCAGYCSGAGAGYACSKRSGGKYAAWGYYIDTNGSCQPLSSGTPACPKL